MEFQIRFIDSVQEEGFNFINSQRIERIDIKRHKNCENSQELNTNRRQNVTIFFANFSKWNKEKVDGHCSDKHIKLIETCNPVNRRKKIFLLVESEKFLKRNVEKKVSWLYNIRIAPDKIVHCEEIKSHASLEYTFVNSMEFHPNRSLVLGASYFLTSHLKSIPSLF